MGFALVGDHRGKRIWGGDQGHTYSEKAEQLLPEDGWKERGRRGGEALGRLPLNSSLALRSI
jgi:hypothetical protein